MSGRERPGPEESWSDARLHAALVARAGRPVPGELLPSTMERVCATRQAWRWGPALPRRLELGAASITAAVLAATLLVFLPAVPLFGPGAPSHPPGPAGFPSEVAGLRVRTVAEVLAERASGLLRGQAIAVGGYYSMVGGHSCAPPARPTAELELWCDRGDQALADADESVLEIGGSGSGVTYRPHEFASAHLQPVLLRYIQADGLWERPITLDQTTRAIFIGHFDDPRALDCPAHKRLQCADEFVVDRLAWAHGESFGPSVWPGDPGVADRPRLTPDDVAALAAQALGPNGAVLAMAAIQSREVAGIDPTTDLDPTGIGLVWYVRAVDGVGAPRSRGRPGRHGHLPRRDG